MHDLREVYFSQMLRTVLRVYIESAPKFPQYIWVIGLSVAWLIGGLTNEWIGFTIVSWFFDLFPGLLMATQFTYHEYLVEFIAVALTVQLLCVYLLVVIVQWFILCLWRRTSVLWIPLSLLGWGVGTIIGMMGSYMLRLSPPIVTIALCLICGGHLSTLWTWPLLERYIANKEPWLRSNTWGWALGGCIFVMIAFYSSYTPEVWNLLVSFPGMSVSAGITGSVATAYTLSRYQISSK